MGCAVTTGGTFTVEVKGRANPVAVTRRFRHIGWRRCASHWCRGMVSGGRGWLGDNGRFDNRSRSNHWCFNDRSRRDNWRFHFRRYRYRSFNHWLCDCRFGFHVGFFNRRCGFGNRLYRRFFNNDWLFSYRFCNDRSRRIFLRWRCCFSNDHNRFNDGF